MIEAIRGVTDQPIKYGLHTQNHWDHTSGEAVFQVVGAETAMHALAAGYFVANPGQDTLPPDIGWDGDRHDISIGGLTVFVDPELRVADIGDLVTPNGCTKPHVEEERQSLGDLRGAIFAEFQNGTPADQIPGMIELPQSGEGALVCRFTSRWLAFGQSDRACWFGTPMVALTNDNYNPV